MRFVPSSRTRYIAAFEHLSAIYQDRLSRYSPITFSRHLGLMVREGCDVRPHMVSAYPPTHLSVLAPVT